MLFQHGRQRRGRSRRGAAHVCELVDGVPLGIQGTVRFRVVSCWLLLPCPESRCAGVTVRCPQSGAEPGCSVSQCGCGVRQARAGGAVHVEHELACGGAAPLWGAGAVSTARRRAVVCGACAVWCAPDITPDAWRDTHTDRSGHQRHVTRHLT